MKFTMRAITADVRRTKAAPCTMRRTIIAGTAVTHRYEQEARIRRRSEAIVTEKALRTCSQGSTNNRRTNAAIGSSPTRNPAMPRDVEGAKVMIEAVKYADIAERRHDHETKGDKFER